MKKLLLRVKAAIFAAIAFVGRAAIAAFEPIPGTAQFTRNQLLGLKQGGFILLGKNYLGYASGTIVELPASTEAAMIAAGQATTSAGPPTTGNVTTTATSGCVAIAAGSSSVTITNPNITVQTQIWACVAQAAADGTLLRVERVLCSAGSVTIYGTANATATTLIDWSIINANGSFALPI